MILSAYVARRFLRLFLMIAAIFAAILFLIDIVEQIRRFSDEGIGLTGAAGLSALNITSAFYSILPLITVLSGIALFLNLSRSSELVAIRASGRSGLRVLAAPAVTAALVGVVCVAVLNPMVAATAKRYDAAVARIQSDGGQTVSLGEDAVWLRQALRTRDAQGHETLGQVVIRASRASPDATTLYDATFMIFAPDQGPARRIDAAEARLADGAWQLRRVKEWPLTEVNPEAMARSFDSLDLPTDLTAARIRDSFGRPEAIPIWQLPAFIKGLERAGFSAQRHKVWFQMELARPLLMAAMIAIAAAFTMRHMRGRKMGMLVLGAFGCGIGLFFLRNLTQVLGENGGIPPALAGWAPPIVALLFAFGALLRLEDG
ncbi:LPS export ABC transporter permease LptG [Paracoccus shanxieyensis]|uniref:LPS export ABC transporter permease LptG n=1 Tax=Paracoccus shanxieyensis TaxID=2675752 RepID=A0A6L6J1F2_9RHOB|nr:LPS export ABC transporter permease LptG [Paracoccus shanxieyensis]MTH65100.1 LPS export ABC transporter permease LptG [Paracoccus shanxieyensis]MTH88244.1 LPS export ABC transporter permease LptG [Paracoccus shanxieyensis]